MRVSYGSRVGAGNFQAEHFHGTTRGDGHWSRGPYSSIDELTEALKAEIKAAAQSAVPDCITVELHFQTEATLPLHRPNIGPYAEGGAQDLPREFKTATSHEDGTTITDPFPTANVRAIVNVTAPRERQIVQRAASRGILAAVEAADGYKYSFNNAWNAKDEEGSRFSYICQDSMQNKDRHANGFTRTLKHLKSEGERGPRKPTYDCKGAVSVKFSTTRQSVDVYYRHYAIHPTVAERKTPNRSSAKSRASLSPKESGGLAAVLQVQSTQAVNYASSVLPMADRLLADDSPLAAKSGGTKGRKGSISLKRKRELEPPPVAKLTRDVPQLLSLAELLQQSGTADARTSTTDSPTPARPVARRGGMPPPIKYELPSWQAPLGPQPLLRPPPPPPPPPPAAVQAVTGGSHSAPYPPPYNLGLKTHALGSQVAGTLSTATSPNVAKSRKGPSSAPAPAPAPAPALVSKAQGLFTTMKPVAPKARVVQQSSPPGKPGTAIHATHSSLQSRTPVKASCTDQTQSKKQNDANVLHGLCTQSGQPDSGDGSVTGNRSTPAGSSSWKTPLSTSLWVAFTPTSGPHTTAASASSAAAREEIPDPWFPER